MQLAIQRYTDPTNTYIDWEFIFRRYRFAEDDLSRHKMVIDWGALCRNHPLTVRFIQRHLEYISFIELSRSAFIDDAVVRAFTNQLDIWTIAKHRVLSLDCARDLLLDADAPYMRVMALMRHYRFDADTIAKAVAMHGPSMLDRGSIQVISDGRAAIV